MYISGGLVNISPAFHWAKEKVVDSIRRPVVAGNWKMNGNVDLVSEMESLFAANKLDNVDVIICPPAPFLTTFTKCAVKLGGQNLSQFESGAHTGEISGKMLKDSGCEYVIVGHSERRADNGESNNIVADKVDAALQQGLTPVLCVGEPLEIRENGQLFTYIAAQLDAVIEKVGIDSFSNMILAYEPVWAIGTGKTASPEQAQEVHAFIRNHVNALNSELADKVVILYGGSVKANNAAELFSQPDVDGGLIGGASLDPQDFISICQSANL